MKKQTIKILMRILALQLEVIQTEMENQNLDYADVRELLKHIQETTDVLIKMYKSPKGLSDDPPGSQT